MIFISTRTSVYKSIGGMELYIREIIRSLEDQETIVLLDKDGIHEITKKNKCTLKKFEKSSSNKLKKIDFINCMIRTFLFLRNNKNQFKNYLFFGHAGILALLFIPRIRKLSKVFYLGFEFLILKGVNGGLINHYYMHYMLSKISCSTAENIMLIENSQRNLIINNYPNYEKKLQVLNNFVSIDEKHNEKLRAYKTSNLKFLSIGRDCNSKQRQKLVKYWPKLYGKLSTLGYDPSLLIICPNPSSKLIEISKKLEAYGTKLKTNVGYQELNELRKNAQFEISFSIQQIPLLSLLESMYFGVIPVINNSHGSFFDNTNSIFIDSFEENSLRKSNIEKIRQNVIDIATKRNQENFKRNVKKIIYGN